MPSSLRARIALFALLGVFLIPLGTSSLRGLTHVVSCDEPTEVPFTLVTNEDGRTSVTSSAVFERGEEQGICGGLILDMSATIEAPGRVLLRLPLTNKTGFDWKGTVTLKLGDTTVPVDIGRIKAGETREDSVKVRVPTGELEVAGTLLIGP